MCHYIQPAHTFYSLRKYNGSLIWLYTNSNFNSKETPKYMYKVDFNKGKLVKESEQV